MDAAQIAIDVLDPAPPAETAWVADRVEPIARAGLGVEKRVVGLFLRDADGTLAAGAKLEVTDTDLHVLWLWTDAPQRGRGLGGLLLAAAEAAAAERGCTRIFLNTMDFQARDYYPRFGYAPFAVIPRFVHGADRTYFRKAVAPAPLPPVPAGLTLEVTDAPAEADLQRVDDGLTEHWLQAVGVAYAEVGAYARDAAGALVAGVNAIRDGRWWCILDGWVEPAHRGRGLATRLVRALEDAARAAGAESIAAVPYEWQAPDFLKRLGYAAVTHFPDAVLGRQRWFVRKELTP